MMSKMAQPTGKSSSYMVSLTASQKLLSHSLMRRFWQRVMFCVARYFVPLSTPLVKVTSPLNDSTC